MYDEIEDMPQSYELGDTIFDVIRNAIRRAQAHGRQIRFEFNDVIVTVAPDSVPELIDRDWERAIDGRIPSMQVGPHPEPELTPTQLTPLGGEFEASDSQAWEQIKQQLQADRRDSSVLDFAVAWARVMQYQLAQGKTIEEIANGTFWVVFGLHEVDSRSCDWALDLLIQHWQHGETLAQCHRRESVFSIRASD